MSSLIMVLFAVMAVFILGTALMVVTVRNIIHAALWLIACFFSVGALYVLLEAEFIGVVQVLVYVGAVSILILFAIMLTRDTSGVADRQLYRGWWVAVGVAGALFGLLIVPTLVTTEWATVPPPQAGEAVGIATAREIGTAFMREYLLPFEVASILLLVALIGAIVVAFEGRGGRRVLTLAEELRLKQRRAAAQPKLELPATATEPEGSRE